MYCAGADERRQQFFPDLAMIGARQRAIDGFEAIHQISLHLDAFRGVHFTEAKLGVGDQLEQRAAVANLDPRKRRVRRARDFLPVPQLQIQGRIAEALHHPRQ